MIELMIVIAIIGILAAIAIPNFSRFQAKAKQAEAKGNMKALYTAKKAHFAEKDTFVCGLCGFSPETSARYTYAATASTFVVGTADVVGSCGVTPAETQSTFLVMADANIDNDVTCDAWTINEGHQLINTIDDVSN